MNGKLDILYHDEWMVAVDKPAGHLVHPADEPKDDDEVAMKIIRDQIGELVYSIHRLDRPTSGVLLFGIDREVAKKLHYAFESQQVTKRYLAVVQGQITEEAWECHEPIQKDEGAVERSAHTSFRVLLKREMEDLGEDPLVLIEAVPHSGRFHQIRRHLAGAGFPIVGDYRYAGMEKSDRLGQLLGTGTRMLLQAKSLLLNHPVTGERLLITAELDRAIGRCFPESMISSTHTTI